MNKKRYLILIALIVFCFLAIFPFANPNKEEDSKVNENDALEEIDKDDLENLGEEENEEEAEKEVVEIKPVYVPQYNTNTNNNTTVNKENLDYNLAVKAVEKAEETYNVSDLEEATRLVEVVKDETKQNALIERLDVILDAIELANEVDTLVEKVLVASSKEEMDAARTYLEENEILDRLEDLSNEVIKELLTEKLETINEKLNDITAPTINIEDGAILDSDTAINVTDESDVTIILDGEEIENGYEATNGEHTLEVTDASFNTTIVSFVVDTTDPELEVTYANGVTYIEAIDLTDVKFNVYDSNDELVYENTTEKTIMLSSEDFDAGEYLIEVTDVVGRTTTIDAYVAEDLEEALTYADSVTLYEDIELTESLTISNGEEKVINLNGNKISGMSTTAAASNLIKVDAGASLKLLGDGEISFTAGNPDTDWGETGPKPYPGYANNTISNRGTLVIDGPTIKNNTLKGGASYVIDNYDGGTLQILSGTIEQTGGDVAIRLFAGSATNKNKVTIDGGTIIGNRAIWIQLSGSNSAVAPLIDVTINGGTLTSIDDTYYLAIYSYSFGNSFAQTTVTINGGVFNGHVAFGGGYKGDKENVIVTGGTFNASLGRYTSTGWEDIQLEEEGI